MRKYSLGLCRVEKNGIPIDYLVIPGGDSGEAITIEKAILSGLIRGFCHFGNMTEFDQERLLAVIEQFIFKGRDLTATMLHDMDDLSKVRAHRFNWNIERHGGELVDKRAQWGESAIRRRIKFSKQILSRHNIQLLAQKHRDQSLTFLDIETAAMHYRDDKKTMEAIESNCPSFRKQLREEIMDEVVDAVKHILDEQNAKIAALEKDVERYTNMFKNGSIKR